MGRWPPQRGSSALHAVDEAELGARIVGLGGIPIERLETARLRSSYLVTMAGHIGLAAFMDAAGITCSQRLGIHHPVDPERIVVAPVEEATGPGVSPVCPLPRLASTDSKDAPWAIGFSHPRRANARAAAITSGPTSSNSPSRSSRAGERSSRYGFNPWNHAWTTRGVSPSARKTAT